MKKIVIVCVLLCVFLIAAKQPAKSPEQKKADLILRKGKIFTMDAARSWAESMAIHKGRIVYVGEDNDLQTWIGPETKSIQLNGRMVLPGFIDSHVHPVEGGVGLLLCDLSKYENKDDVLKAIRDYAEKHPQDEWIVGSGWQLPVFPQANPKKEWLDAIIPNRPVFMSAADGHSAWVNSKALQLSGITKQTKDPENGRIEHDASGEPSGTLRESAADLVYRIVPKPGLEERIIGLKQALHLMNGFGITGVQDASVSTEGDSPEARGAANVYREAEKRGVLTARVTGALYADPEGSIQQVLKQVDKLKKMREEFKSKYFHPTAVKIFADGVIEANTAAMLQPYLDKANDAGILNWEPEKLNAMVELLDKEKFQIHIHAIGDRAIRVSLTALEAANETNSPRDRRPIIAHLEVIDPADIPRFAKIGVIPCFQPLWAYADSYIKELTLPKLGPERSRWIYPLHSVLVTGANLALGSDWNVSSVNPLDGIQVAVTRKGLEPKKDETSFIPEERIDLADALAGYTIGSAYANFLDKETGSIEAGKSADMIVLSNNLFDVPAEQISKTKVLLTLLEGKEIYRDPSW